VRTARSQVEGQGVARAVRVGRKGETSFGRLETNPEARTARGVRSGDATIDEGAVERASVRPINRVRGGDAATDGGQPADANPRGSRVSRIDMDGVSPVTGDEAAPVRSGVRSGSSNERGSDVVRPRSEPAEGGTQRTIAPSTRERGGEKPGRETVRVERTPASEPTATRVERGSTGTPPVSRTTVRPVETNTRSYESPARRQSATPVESKPSVRATEPGVSRQRERYQAPAYSAPSVTQPSQRVEPPARERSYERPGRSESPAPQQRFESAPAQRERVRGQPVQPESSNRFSPQRSNSVNVVPPARDIAGRGAVSVRPRSGESGRNSEARGR